MPKKFFEDCRVGEKMQTSGRTITEGDITQFAALTGDWMPLHTDAEYARQTIYGERIAHGLFVMSLGAGLLQRLGEHEVLPASSIALCGYEKVRFDVPARIGDTVHAEAEVTKMQDLGPARGLLTIRVKMINQRAETVVVFRMSIAVGRRDP